MSDINKFYDWDSEFNLMFFKILNQFQSNIKNVCDSNFNSISTKERDLIFGRITKSEKEGSIVNTSEVFKELSTVMYDLLKNYPSKLINKEGAI